MTAEEIAAAAETIAARRLGLTPLALAPPLKPETEAEAYAIQDAAHRLLTASGEGPIVGRKIGCTTEVMQRYLGIPNPCAGGIFARHLHASGAELDPRRYLRVGIECEIALRLGRDLPAAGAPYGAAAAGAALDAVMAAVEIVDDRYAGWPTVGTPTLIAADFFGAGCVLGPPVAAAGAPPLETVAGEMLINGATVGRGSGADVLGHPFVALAWLANSLAARGAMLRAGDIVMSGSVVQTHWLEPGDRAAVVLAGLGRVELAIGTGQD
jgi:2-oxo-3-hexenedioate decarboxylase/2-keto-4-pentenoate hydratase